MILGRYLRTSVLVSSLAFVPIVACGGSGAPAARPVSVTFDDATVTTRVKTALLNDPNVGARQIDVSSTNGVVTLSGVVKTEAEIARAIEIAKTIGGVKEVQSTLKAQP
jgi:hyperosmotically inducible periplasmic protein